MFVPGDQKKLNILRRGRCEPSARQQGSTGPGGQEQNTKYKQKILWRLKSERHPVAFHADFDSVTRLRQAADVGESAHLFVDAGNPFFHWTLHEQTDRNTNVPLRNRKQNEPDQNITSESGRASSRL